ncbi:hypothetical protein SNEBB_002286 [Seison nebaliae]|nr:hypothetical protein SNEBB_002286 [Seison nebaliae]
MSNKSYSDRSRSGSGSSGWTKCEDDAKNGKKVDRERSSSGDSKRRSHRRTEGSRERRSRRHDERSSRHPPVGGGNGYRRSRSQSRSASPRRRRSHSGGRYGSRSRSPGPPTGHYGRYDGRPRQNPSRSKVLAVFNLSYMITETDLEHKFTNAGIQVRSAKIVYERHGQRSRGFGFVYFNTESEAARAKDKLHGVELDGKPMRIDYSISNKPHSPTPGYYMGKKRERYGNSSRYHEYRYHDDPYDRRSPSPRYYSRSGY